MTDHRISAQNLSVTSKLAATDIYLISVWTVNSRETHLYGADTVLRFSVAGSGIKNRDTPAR